MAYNNSVTLFKAQSFMSATATLFDQRHTTLAIQDKKYMLIQLRTFEIPAAPRNIPSKFQNIGDIFFQNENNQVFPKFYLNRQFDDYMRANFPNSVLQFEGTMELQRSSSLVESKSFNKSFKSNFREIRALPLTDPFPFEMVDPIQSCRWVLRSSTLTIKLEEEMWLGSNLKSSADDLLQNLFQGNPPKDFILVAGNGTEISCHGVILGAQSSALAAMVNPNGMKESECKRIEMKMFSEETLTAFVRYIYRQPVPLKNVDCDMALELFRLGHMYQLPEMPTTLSKMMLQKGKEWFSPNSILELYFLLKTMNQEEFKELADHIVAVMLKMTEAVRQCERFQELGLKEANELLWILLNKSISG